MFHQVSGWWFILLQTSFITPLISAPIKTESSIDILTEDDQDILTE